MITSPRINNYSAENLVKIHFKQKWTWLAAPVYTRSIIIISFIHKKTSDIRKHRKSLDYLLVRMTGVEPARLAALDPKSSASANSATSA